MRRAVVVAEFELSRVAVKALAEQLAAKRKKLDRSANV